MGNSSIFNAGPNDVLATFSNRDFRKCVYTYKHLLKDRINEPSPK